MHFTVASVQRSLAAAFTLLCFFTSFAWAVESQDGAPLVEHDPVYETENQNVFYTPNPANSIPTNDDIHSNAPIYSPSMAINALQDLHVALETMQAEYFELWLGKWATAIDWTAAVVGTHLSATLSSLSHSLTYTMPGTFDKARKLDVEAQRVENEINKYFSQTITYYFGEDHFAIRNQAFDDILWVVLGWLESIQFISAHSDDHYPPSSDVAGGKSEWYARQFVPAFAHRARVFYELAEKGWDWRLCGGGMTWNPRLLPYKNAITNELFISASAAMYLHFPGDENCSPFMSTHKGEKRAKHDINSTSCSDATSGPTYDPIYLSNAINGYDWLKNSGMTNDRGLYVDGFHIRDYSRNHSKTTCDERNEMVYTYNQGVLLSGLRNLWEATGNHTYLSDGHTLIRNVIRATGWPDSDLRASTHTAAQSPDPSPESHTDSWSGLGAAGILTELCDPSATCSQNGQTFKSIFFHHLTSFCTPLPRVATRPGKTHAATRETARLHRNSCNSYAPWVVHNAHAALRTRDARGRFGMWWGVDPTAANAQADGKRAVPVEVPNGAVDYRNEGRGGGDVFGDGALETVEGYRQPKFHGMPERRVESIMDLNERGRGRTVETQAGGVAVLRAMWEFLSRYEEGDEV